MLNDYWQHLTYTLPDKAPLAILIFILILVLTTCVGILFILLTASIITLINSNFENHHNLKQRIARVMQILKQPFTFRSKPNEKPASIHIILFIMASLPLFFIFLLIPFNQYILIIPSEYNSILCTGLIILVLISITFTLSTDRHTNLLSKSLLFKSGLTQIMTVLLMLLTLVPLIIKSKSMHFSVIVNGQNQFLAPLLPNWNIIGSLSGLLGFLIYFYLGIIYLQQSQHFISHLESDSELKDHWFNNLMGIFLKTSIFIFFMIGTHFFLGGWLEPYQKWSLENHSSLAIILFFLKTILFYWLVQKVNYHLPNLSCRQIFQLNLKYLIPINLLNIILAQIKIII